MYRVLKPSGYGMNLTVENTDTMVNVVIGKLNADILEILKGKHEPISIADEWNFEIDKETAEKLVALVTKGIKKPIRDQRKHKETDDKQIVDVLDIIYGLA